MSPSANGTPKGTPRTSPRLRAKQQEKNYEFSAPQYYDFQGPSPGNGAPDSWFEKRHSPETAKSTCTPKGLELSPQVPPTVTQNRRRYSNEQSLHVEETPLEPSGSGGHFVQSPMVVVNSKSSSSNMFQSGPSPSTKRQNSYEKLFQMTKKDQHHHQRDRTETHEPQLGKVRTPDRVKLAKLKTAGPLLPTRSTKPLTVPMEFNFSERTRPQKRVSFDLSKNAVRPIPPIPTIKKTAIAAVKLQEKQLTQPKSPMLMTKLRQKPVSKELEEIKKVRPFKARPVDPKTLNGTGNVGISQVKKTKITVPIDIHLETATRVHHVPEKQQQEGVTSTSSFKAIPVPIDVLQQHPIGGIPHKREYKLTIPKSPNIHKPAQKKHLPDPSQLKEEPVPFKARPAPRSKPFIPKIEHSYIEPLSVHLPGEVITEEKRRKFQEALNKERSAAEEARIFHARPLPDFSEENNAGVPPAKLRQLTKPEPFQLQSDLRTAMHQAELRRRLEDENEQLRREREFHSRPAPHSAPFLARKSTKPLTQTENVHLHSMERADKRRDFDEMLHRKEEEMVDLERKQQELRKQREEEELRELRRQLVPKAQPIIRTAPPELKPSSRPLTVPHSPALTTARRSRKRNDNE